MTRKASIHPQEVLSEIELNVRQTFLLNIVLTSYLHSIEL